MTSLPHWILEAWAALSRTFAAALVTSRTGRAAALATPSRMLFNAADEPVRLLEPGVGTAASWPGT